VHLDELKNISKDKGGDFARAHLESFLYHLLGVKDAFLMELNHYYGCELDAESVTPGNLREHLATKGRSSSELVKLYKLQEDADSWLSKAIAMRNHGTHVGGVPLTYNLGGEAHGQTWLGDLKTRGPIPSDYVVLFEDWHVKMRKFILELRQSALRATGATK